MGRGNINFEKIIRALNDIGYDGPLSVEWEDGGMDREHGATESAAFVRQLRSRHGPTVTARILVLVGANEIDLENL